jgi:hypothetical protein
MYSIENSARHTLSMHVGEDWFCFKNITCKFSIMGYSLYFVYTPYTLIGPTSGPFMYCSWELGVIFAVDEKFRPFVTTLHSNP